MIPLPPHDCWSRPTHYLGRRVLQFAKLDSTNDLALVLGSDPANDGLVLLAGEQNAGRGQYGRSWQAPARSSVLMSVLLFPPPHLCRPVVLTAWAAVAVAETIAELTDLQPKIKWPNDVYLNGKKVCGILIEQRGIGRPGEAPATAVGIGLNVSQPGEFFDQAGLTLGGSLLSITARRFDYQEVARKLIHRLDDLYALLLEGNLAPLEIRWKQRLGLAGKQVRAETLAGSREGRLVDVSFEAIVLDVGANEPLQMLPETVRQLTG